MTDNSKYEMTEADIYESALKLGATLEGIREMISRKDALKLAQVLSNLDNALSLDPYLSAFLGSEDVQDMADEFISMLYPDECCDCECGCCDDDEDDLGSYYEGADVVFEDDAVLVIRK